MRRWRLSKKERRKVIETLISKYPGFNRLVSENSILEYLVEKKHQLILIDGIPAFIVQSTGGEAEKYIPHLKFLLRKGTDWLPRVVVDQGAVRPISRGADLMRPGIIEIKDGFTKGDIIVVLDPQHYMPLAVHEALYDSKAIEAMSKGRVSKSIHHVGDVYWKLI